MFDEMPFFAIKYGQTKGNKPISAGCELALLPHCMMHVLVRKEFIFFPKPGQSSPLLWLLQCRASNSQRPQVVNRRNLGQIALHMPRLRNPSR